MRCSVMKNNLFDIDDKDLAILCITVIAVVAMACSKGDIAVVTPAITALAGLAVGRKLS